MQITKQQMINGAVKYIRSEIIPHVPDRGFKVALETIGAIAEMNPQIAMKYFESPLVSVALNEKDGFYDLDVLEAALIKAVESHGNLELIVPAIPLISPQAKSLAFSANDIRTIKKYMES